MENTRLIVKLARIKEHLFFDIPLSLIGTIIAANQEKVNLDSKIIVVALANVLTVSFAFMINEIEDAEDDAKNPMRKNKNPVSSGKLKKKEAHIFIFLTAALAVILFYSLGTQVFLIGLMAIWLAFFYSWKGVRFKAWPVIDVLSHALMLSGLLFLAGYAVYSTNFLAVWPLFLAVMLVSAYGQIYNQIRDFEDDKKAKLKNTSIVLGFKFAKILMYLMIASALVSLIYAFYLQILPVWIVVPFLIIIPLAKRFKTTKDFRGTKLVDKTGAFQALFLAGVNFAVVAWLMVEIIK